MISTARTHLSAGPSYDVGIYRARGHTRGHTRSEAGSGSLDEFECVWYRHLSQALRERPMVDPGDVNPLRPLTFTPYRASYATARVAVELAMSEWRVRSDRSRFCAFCRDWG